MITKVKQLFLRCLRHETSPEKCATATALAVYIAFCPFFGIHTFMTIAAGVLFRLNLPLLLLVGNVINNPLTMVPIYMSGYVLGYWLLHTVLGFSVAASNPWWMASVNSFIHTYLKVSDVSFWAFMLGGNVLGGVLGLLCYKVMQPLFLRLATENKVY
jgi:hypothetical protein